MAKGYWINTFRAIHDPDKVARYAELASTVIPAAGGRFLARGKPYAAFESGLVERTVIIEFPSAEQAVRTYESPEYQEALGLLDGGAERDIRIIEGVPEG